MRFMRNEWVPGAKAVFEKFAGYAPRQEPASWLAGGKNIVIDRIEWITIPDPATAAAALQNGEIDWLEVVIPDLLPILRKNRNLVTAIRDPLGTVGVLVMNHLYPPFNDVRARRATHSPHHRTNWVLVSPDVRRFNDWSPAPNPT